MFAKFEHIIECAYDYNEALKRQNLKQEDVDLLREKAKRSKLIPRFIHDKQLLLFINACKNDVEKSSKWLHLYYKMKRNSPEFFKNRDVFSDEIQQSFENQVYLSLPVTPNNCNVVLHKMSNLDPKAYNFDEAIKTFIITAEACTFKNGPRNATIFIYDFEGGKFRHLLRPSISSIRKCIEFLQVGSPLNVEAFHIFNVPYFIDIVFSMIRPFIRKELYQRVHLHQSSTDYEDFFTKFIPRSHMPKDYGGELDTVQELHDQNRQLLIDMREYFIAEEDQMNYKFEDHVVEPSSNDESQNEFYDAKDE